MRVAMIGLGRLGLPVSCAMVMKGHKVYGYDIDQDKREMFKVGKCDLYEPNIEQILGECLDSGQLVICDSVLGAMHGADIVFVAVPTPSNEDDSFDTSYVKTVLREIVRGVDFVNNCKKVIAIISTVLPGTTRTEFKPILQDAIDEGKLGLCYNAQFIAMGTTIQDMLNPEFVLIGQNSEWAGDRLGAFYSQLVDAPLLRMSLESAETVKMAYNTMIGFKIVYANALMELCDKTPGADCDVVSGAISMATKRLLSPRYLKGGMGDGGGCHPRDNRALSFLAKKLKLSADPFEFVMAARDSQSRRLAQVVRKTTDKYQLPLVIMGLTFKPETNLTLDSPSLLLIEHLRELYLVPAHTYDPIVKKNKLPSVPMIFVLATCHKEFRDYPFPSRSIVIDPWRMLENVPDDIIYIPIGRKQLKI